jgi:glyoxylase-like metal-dependent hydrolase (beta-lactamase superfamily II)/ferredoxin
MARIDRILPDNVPGLFYVDNSCIDCDACRILSPSCFSRKNEQSIVYRQPSNETELFQALQALIACPTASIGSSEKFDLKKAQRSFPNLIDGNVYNCGYHSSDSYGAASYFILRKEGNILIDSPRFNRPLVERLKELGGIRYLFLTHRDDVADHAKFQKEFRCERVMHQDDISVETHDIEIKVKGEEEIRIFPDLVLLPVPGHTKGHIALIYRDKFAFTGDHLAYSPELNQLVAFRNACWYSWEEVNRSINKLSTYAFEWVLPGHGRRFYGTRERMRLEMQKCQDWMKGS